jgi:pimeloyl-ACP methyl ester carboxylesterase
MKWRALLVGGGVAAGIVVLGRKLALKEDLEWELVEKPGQVIDIDGYRVHYVEQGSGPAMVLVHGFGGSTYQYRKLMPLLARDHRVVAVDLKGFGYSERDAAAGLSQSDQVAMLRALLPRLGITRAVFAGHSMGGGVVQRFAATYPEMVEALVLIASVTGEERHARRALGPALVLRPLLPLLAGLAASRLIKGSFYDQSQLTPEVREGYLRPARIKGSMDGLIAMMRDGARDEPVDAARITCPVLVLSAAHDTVVPLSSAQRIRERLPQARLVVIDRAAHVLIEEQPEACAGAIRDFLAETAGAAGAVPRAAF